MRQLQQIRMNVAMVALHSGVKRCSQLTVYKFPNLSKKKTVHTFYYRKYDTIINEHLQPIGALDSNNYRIWYTKCNGPLCVINMRYQWRMTNGVVNEHSHCIASGNKKGDVGYRGSIWTFIFSFLVADLRPIGMPFIVGKYVTNTVFSALTADEWVDE